MRDIERERQREELHVSTHPSAQAKAKAKAKAGLGLRNTHYQGTSSFRTIASCREKLMIFPFFYVFLGGLPRYVPIEFLGWEEPPSSLYEPSFHIHTYSLTDKLVFFGSLSDIELFELDGTDSKLYGTGWEPHGTCWEPRGTGWEPLWTGWEPHGRRWNLCGTYI